jgi:hypothetical protein
LMVIGNFPFMVFMRDNCRALGFNILRKCDGKLNHIINYKCR